MHKLTSYDVTSFHLLLDAWIRTYLHIRRAYEFRSKTFTDSAEISSLCRYKLDLIECDVIWDVLKKCHALFMTHFQKTMQISWFMSSIVATFLFLHCWFLSIISSGRIDSDKINHTHCFMLSITCCGFLT